MRTALKSFKNLPLKVYADNDFIIVDESAALQFTKWDDENGILYTFRLMSIDQSRNPSNLEQSISVGAVLYDFIQAMEVAPMPIKEFDNLFTSMEGTGVVFNNEQFKDNIKYAFTQALRPDRVALTHEAINAMTGSKAMGDKPEDYYYSGRYKESFKETRDHAMHNQYALEQIKKSLEEQQQNP